MSDIEALATPVRRPMVGIPAKSHLLLGRQMIALLFPRMEDQTQMRSVGGLNMMKMKLFILRHSEGSHGSPRLW